MKVTLSMHLIITFLILYSTDIHTSECITKRKSGNKQNNRHINPIMLPSIKAWDERRNAQDKRKNYREFQVLCHTLGKNPQTVSLPTIYQLSTSSVHRLRKNNLTLQGRMASLQQTLKKKETKIEELEMRNYSLACRISSILIENLKNHTKKQHRPPNNRLQTVVEKHSS